MKLFPVLNEFWVLSEPKGYTEILRLSWNDFNTTRCVFASVGTVCGVLLGVWLTLVSGVCSVLVLISWRDLLANRTIANMSRFIAIPLQLFYSRSTNKAMTLKKISNCKIWTNIFGSNLTLNILTFHCLSPAEMWSAWVCRLKMNIVLTAATLSLSVDKFFPRQSLSLSVGHWGNCVCL